MKKIILSYSVIDMLHKCNHGWINRVMNIESPTSEAMEKGKVAHKILQDHVSHKKIIKDMELGMTFPTIEYHAQKPYNEKYSWHGYVDAANFASKCFLEIKTSGSKIWSQGDFDKSMQPRYYSWVTNLKKAYFITCKFDLSDLRTYYREFTHKDWEKAEKWAKEAIEIIEAGKFDGGLDENGKCMSWRGGCNFGENCYFA